MLYELRARQSHVVAVSVRIVVEFRRVLELVGVNRLSGLAEVLRIVVHLQFCELGLLLVPRIILPFAWRYSLHALRDHEEVHLLI